MAATVAELTPAELRALVAEVVHEQLIELLGDPDEGLELRPDFARLLQERVAHYEEEGNTLTLEEAFAPFEGD